MRERDTGANRTWPPIDHRMGSEGREVRVTPGESADWGTG